MHLSTVFDVWFRPKGFESKRLYEQLGTLLIKRYEPTGGDLVMHRLRRDHPSRRWVTRTCESLRRYERRTRLNESIHLIGFIGFAVLAAEKSVSGSLSLFGFTVHELEPALRTLACRASKVQSAATVQGNQPLLSPLGAPKASMSVSEFIRLARERLC